MCFSKTITYVLKNALWELDSLRSIIDFEQVMQVPQIAELVAVIFDDTSKQ